MREELGVPSYPSDGARQTSGDRYAAGGVSGIGQAEKQISRGRRDGDAVGAVAARAAAGGDFKPVNEVVLRAAARRKHQSKRGNRFFMISCCFTPVASSEDCRERADFHGMT